MPAFLSAIGLFDALCLDDTKDKKNVNEGDKVKEARIHQVAKLKADIKVLEKEKETLEKEKETLETKCESKPSDESSGDSTCILDNKIDSFLQMIIDSVKEPKEKKNLEITQKMLSIFKKCLIDDESVFYIEEKDKINNKSFENYILKIIIQLAPIQVYFQRFGVLSVERGGVGGSLEELKLDTRWKQIPDPKVNKKTISEINKTISEINETKDELETLFENKIELLESDNDKELIMYFKKNVNKMNSILMEGFKLMGTIMGENEEKMKKLKRTIDKDFEPFDKKISMFRKKYNDYRDFLELQSREGQGKREMGDKTEIVGKDKIITGKDKIIPVEVNTDVEDNEAFSKTPKDPLFIFCVFSFVIILLIILFSKIKSIYKL